MLKTLSSDVRTDLLVLVWDSTTSEPIVVQHGHLPKSACSPVVIQLLLVITVYSGIYVLWVPSQQ